MLAGLHAKNILYVLDEAGSIPMAVLAAIEGILTTGEQTKVFLIGNVTSKKGCLYQSAYLRPAMGYKSVRVTTDPEDPDRSRRVDPQYPARLIKEYGRTHPFVKVNVLAEAPDAEISALLGATDVSESVARKVQERDCLGYVPYAGLDPSGRGEDRTALCVRRGPLAWPPVRMGSCSPEEVVRRTVEYLRNCVGDDWPKTRLIVDGTGGWSLGIEGMLSTTGLKWRAVTFNQKPPQQPERYQNMRAFLYSKLSDWVRKSGRLPDDADLHAELLAQEAHEDKEKLCLIPKREIRQALGRSPDSSDSMALTFAESSPLLAEVHRGIRRAVGRRGRAYSHLDRSRIFRVR